MDPGHTVFVSRASAWEMVIKASIGKLPVIGPIADLLKNHVFNNGFRLLEIQTEHLSALETLPMHHRDPFDRMLIAQALAEDIPVFSDDAQFNGYPIELLW